MTLKTAMMIAFILNAVWWIAFTLPLVKSYKQKFYIEPEAHPVLDTFARLKDTLIKAKEQKKVFLFLFAFFFYIDGVYTITVTFKEEDTYKGGRIVKPASWDTIGGWADVDADSKVYLDETKDPANLDDKGNSVNGDGNLVFKEAGTYVISFDLVGKKITITKQ